MTLYQRLTSLIQAIAGDVKSLAARVSAIEKADTAVGLVDGGNPTSVTTGQVLRIDFGGVQ